MFSILRQFVAGEDPERIAEWNDRWENLSFRMATRIVTAVWGVVYLAEASLRVVLAIKLTPQQVMSISSLMSIGVLVVLIAWTRRYMSAFRRS
jgi:hypothetical protein